MTENWTAKTTGYLAHGYLVNCGGIHCYRLMHPYKYACCGVCASARESGKATVAHSEGCDKNHEGRIKQPR